MGGIGRALSHFMDKGNMGKRRGKTASEEPGSGGENDYRTEMTMHQDFCIMGEAKGVCTLVDICYCSSSEVVE